MPVDPLPPPSEAAPEPVAPLVELVPVEPVLAPVELEEPVPSTCWPTVRLTAATVPAMVEVSVASETEVWASVTVVCVEAMFASSEAI